MVVVMYLIAAFDPLSWHADDAGYPSVTLLVLFAAGVLVAAAAVLWVVSAWRPRYRGLLIAGIAGLVGGIVGNVAGILTIHKLGGGNSAADIWAYPVVWYIGNPADASIALGSILLLVWVARLVLASAGKRAVSGTMVAVAVLPLLVAGSYTVARSAEIAGWQAPANEQLTRVVAHRGGLSESMGSRACAAQFAQQYHRPESVVLTAADCPAVLRYASMSASRWDVLIGSAPPGTLRAASSGSRGRARHSTSDPPKTASPSIAVTIGADGSVTATVAAVAPAKTAPPGKATAPAKVPAQPASSPGTRSLTAAQRHQLNCVRRALAALDRTEPRFAALAVEALCPER